MIFISAKHRILKKFQEKLHLFLHTLTILWFRHSTFNFLSNHNLHRHQSLKRNSSAQPWLNHQKFLVFLKEKLKDYYGSSLGKSFLRHYAPLIIKISLLNLDKSRHILKSQYSSSKKGRKPIDPASMLRSLLLMTLSKESSITNWVSAIKNIPLLAILSGFDPQLPIPGVGTFYDFSKRCYPKTTTSSPNRKIKRKFKPKPRQKKKQGEKLPPKHPEIVKKLVEQIISNKKLPLTKHSEKILNQILKECFVYPSAEKGLLGNPQRLSMAGDGTLIKSGGSHFGIKVCNCKKNGYIPM